MSQAYWEQVIKDFFINWKDLKTPLTHQEHFKKPQLEKKLLTIDDLKPLTKKSQQETKKKRGRRKKST
jgi:hypothetical protein